MENKITWQIAAIILTTILLGSGGLLQYTDLMGVLFQLKGVNYTFTGDQHCGETCEAYINVTTNYWRICFANYTDTKYENETIFKKVSRSRTLHANLGLVSDYVTTNPNLTTEWLVSARGKGNWRDIKDGDCWDRGKINKIKLVFHKEEWQNAEWKFKTGDLVDIDPYLIGTNKNDYLKLIFNTNYCNDDCETIYEICSVDYNVSLGGDDGKILLRTSTNYSLRNSLPELEYIKYEIPKKYKLFNGTIYNGWTELNKTDTYKIDGCTQLRVSGKKAYPSNIDNVVILEIGEVLFNYSEYAWWNNSPMVQTNCTINEWEDNGSSNVGYDTNGSIRNAFNNQNIILNYLFFNNNLVDEMCKLSFTNNGVTFAAGKINYDAVYDGASYMISDSVIYGTGDKSFLGWIKIGATGAFREIVTNANPGLGGTNDGFEIFMGNTNYVGLIIGNGAPANHYLSCNTGAITTSGYYHIGIIQNSTGAFVYLNGSLGCSDKTFDGTEAVGVNNMYFGRRVSSSAFFFNGRQDEFEFINDSITVADITASFNSGIGARYNTSLKNFYSINNDSEEEYNQFKPKFNVTNDVFNTSYRVSFDNWTTNSGWLNSSNNDQMIDMSGKEGQWMSFQIKNGANTTLSALVSNLQINGSSVNVTPVNQTPTINSINITPSPATTNDDLTCVYNVTNSTSNSIKWYVNGINVLNGTYTPWNLTNCYYDGNSISTQDVYSQDLFFKSDGTKLYEIGFNSNKFYQYTCTDAWDLSSCSYDGISISTQTNSAFDLFFKSDGAKLYEIGYLTAGFYQYSCTDAWNLSSCSYDSVSIGTENAFPTGMFFKSDGIKLYESGSSGTDKFYQYTCGTPWDLSTCSYDSVSINSQDNSVQDLFFKSDGTILYDTGFTSKKFRQYTCTDAWNLSSCSFDSIAISTQDSSPTGMFFKSDGTKLYEIGYNSNKFYQYSCYSNILPNTYFNGSDNVTCVLNATNSYGSTIDNTSIIIATQPVINNITISPFPAATYDNLTCNADITNEGNTTYIWYVNGELVVNDYILQEYANSTSLQNNGIVGIGYFRMNYTIPSFALGTLWQIKYGSANTTNLTLPFNIFTNTIILRVSSITTSAPLDESQPQYYNGTDWVNIGIQGSGQRAANVITNSLTNNWNDGDYSTSVIKASGFASNTFSGDYFNGVVPGGSALYEEAIYWGRSNSSQTLNSSYTSLGDDVTCVVNSTNQYGSDQDNLTIKIQGSSADYSYCSPLDEDFTFDYDLLYFNFDTRVLLQYNVSVENLDQCLFNITNSGNVTGDIYMNINDSRPTNQITCYGDYNITLNTSNQKIYEDLTSNDYELLNCTQDYINATSRGFFLINITGET